MPGRNRRRPPPGPLATLAAVALALGAPAAPALAHPGGLDASGCHTNRKTGDYHCHRGGGSPAPAAATLAPTRALGVMGGQGSGGAFANCSQARAAGAAPVRRGQPGYGPHLDRDGDGVACE